MYLDTQDEIANHIAEKFAQKFPNFIDDKEDGDDKDDEDSEDNTVYS